MKKNIIFIILIITIIIIITLIYLLGKSEKDMRENISLRQSEEKIREDILKFTPIGSNIEEVIMTIENNEKWKDKYEIFDRGYGIMGVGENDYFPTAYYSEEATAFVRVVGVKSIKILAGKYKNIFETYVEIYLGFDENSKLIEVDIKKDKDSL